MVLDKGPEDINYPSGGAKKMKKMPDGNPYPYEMEHNAESGVSDGEVVEKPQRSFKYIPKPSANVGDDGSGGHI